MLGKSVLVMNFCSDFVQVLVDGLLDVKGRTFNSVYVVFNLLKSSKPLLDLPIRPHRLYTISCPLLNDDIDR